MRLIDADKFKQQVAATAIVNNFDVKIVNAICRAIDAQPTAYDVDEVIEQLKERLCSKKDEKTDFDCFMRNNHFREAVEIVKLGGRK